MGFIKNIKDTWSDVQRDMEARKRASSKAVEEKPQKTEKNSSEYKGDRKKVLCPYCAEIFRLGEVKFRKPNKDDDCTKNDVFMQKWKERGWGEGTDIQELEDCYQVDFKQDDHTDKTTDKKDNENDKQGQPDQNTSRKNSPQETETTLGEFTVLENLEFVRDETGFITGAKETTESQTVVYEKRMCPHCFALLPKDYGKYPIKFLPVIGVKGSGKTLYLAELIREINGAYGLSANISNNAFNFEEFFGSNWSDGTTKSKSYPPMFVKVSKKGKTFGTIVLSDIAGEDCENDTALQRHCTHIKHADGIVVLISPEQLAYEQRNMRSKDKIVFRPKDVSQESLENTKSMATVLAALFGAQGRNEKVKAPTAVTLSKSDVYQRTKHGKTYEKDNFFPISDKHSMYGDMNIGKHIDFDKETHQKISADVQKIIAYVYGQQKDLQGTGLGAQLNNFKKREYFACAALGTRKQRRPAIQCARPKRVMEPVGWLYAQWGWIPVRGARFRNLWFVVRNYLRSGIV